MRSMLSRLWGALGSARRAFAFYWKHGHEPEKFTTILAAPQLAAPDPDKACASQAPFYVAIVGDNDENIDVYDGASGGDARRGIEAMKAEGRSWRAYRHGTLWDYGPRKE